VFVNVQGEHEILFGEIILLRPLDKAAVIGRIDFGKSIFLNFGQLLLVEEFLAKVGAEHQRLLLEPLVDQLVLDDSIGRRSFCRRKPQEEVDDDVVHVLLLLDLHEVALLDFDALPLLVGIKAMPLFPDRLIQHRIHLLNLEIILTLKELLFLF
jgi:hypothetical protein